MAYSIYLNRRNVTSELQQLLSVLVTAMNRTGETLRIVNRNESEKKLADKAKRVTVYKNVNPFGLTNDMIPTIENSDELTRKLYANDVSLVLGGNYSSPTKMLITFAGRNSVDPIIRLAQKKGIKVVNLSDRQVLRGLAQTLKKHFQN